MNVVPIQHDVSVNQALPSTSFLPDFCNFLFTTEKVPHDRKNSLTETANVRVGEVKISNSSFLSSRRRIKQQSYMALLAARDIYRPGEVIYLEFIPAQRTFQESKLSTFGKDKHIHLESIGGLKYVNHSSKPNARVYFPCCQFCQDKGHFIGLEVLEPINRGQEITVDYTKAERRIPGYRSKTRNCGSLGF